MMESEDRVLGVIILTYQVDLAPGPAYHPELKMESAIWIVSFTTPSIYAFNAPEMFHGPQHCHSGVGFSFPTGLAKGLAGLSRACYVGLTASSEPCKGTCQVMPYSVHMHGNVQSS